MTTTTASTRPRTGLLRRAANAAGDVLLPQTCVACGGWIDGGGEATCPECTAMLSDILWRSCCHRCARTVRRESLDARGCHRCRGDSTWNVAGTTRVGPYTEPLSGLIVGLKYAGRERNADFLAELMAESLRGRSWLAELDALIPVPMHWKRRLQRPCNHARMLTEALARRLGQRVIRMRRHRYRQSQMRIPIVSKAALFGNVAGCFSVRHPRQVAGKTVCIVDNIVRSGATLHEMSKTLRRAGAKRIYAAIVARTVVPGDMQPASDTVQQETPQSEPRP